MKNGNHQQQRNVVILSIKPKRPAYPAHQKVVPVKEVLQEWDKLDAYYRGQLLKFPSNTSNNNKQSKLKPTTKDISFDKNEDSDPKDHFGDENVYITDTQKLKQRHPDCDISQKKKEIQAQNSTPQNYISSARENFEIKVNSNKKRTVLSSKNPQLLLNPINVGSYSPPVAVGFNSVHIQKILYHKCASSSPSPYVTPPTATGSTPNLNDKGNKQIQDSPKLTDSSVSNYLQVSPKKSLLPATTNCSASKKSTPIVHCTSTNANNNSHSRVYTSPQSVSNSRAISKPHSPPKRKLEGSVKNRDYESPVPVSSTSELFGSPDKRPKKIIQIDEPAEILTSKQKQHNQQSLVNSILSKSKRSLLSIDKKDFAKREKQRRLESRRRKSYADQKDYEQDEMEAVDLAFKSFELILDCPPLSPLSSP